MVAVSIALTIGAALLIWMGLRDTTQVRLWVILAGIALLILNFAQLVTGAAPGATEGDLAFVASVLAAALAVVSGLALALDLRGNRKLVSILVGVIYPVTLILGAIR